MSPEAIRALIRNKGWSLSNLSFRWGVSLGYLCAVVANHERPAHWTDAFVGLPEIDRLTARSWTQRRLAWAASHPKTSARRPVIKVVHERGDLFISTDLVDRGEGYRYVLESPERIESGFDGLVVLIGEEDGDVFEVSYTDLATLFTETGINTRKL